MSLDKYKSKRSQETTPEPFGSHKSHDALKSNKLFVIQKHAASHLHYDFRLEVQGVLVSWAVPKGPSLNPSDKHLAIQVEDHPYDYHDFEGTIPKGSYGGGTVMVWDKGFYTPLNEKEEETDEKSFVDSIKKGKLIFYLHGEKLQGRFSMVRLKNDEDKPHWLLIKGKDEFASSSNILDKDKSALTGRSMEEIAEHKSSLPVKKKASKR